VVEIPIPMKTEANVNEIFKIAFIFFYPPNFPAQANFSSCLCVICA
jgi:hypothetical protein